MTTHLTPPRRFRRLIDRVSERDREWFTRHPDTTERLRPYVPGETWPFHDPTVTHVIVTQVAPGVRTRRPITMLGEVGA